jgi:hypothetical protein
MTVIKPLQEMSKYAREPVELLSAGKTGKFVSILRFKPFLKNVMIAVRYPGWQYDFS